VRCYRITPQGRKQLRAELSDYDRVTQAIQEILRTA
jgi:DNA-binding PadR family transcriptional regulator